MSKCMHYILQSTQTVRRWFKYTAWLRFVVSKMNHYPSNCAVLFVCVVPFFLCVCKTPSLYHCKIRWFWKECYVRFLSCSEIWTKYPFILPTFFFAKLFWQCFFIHSEIFYVGFFLKCKFNMVLFASLLCSNLCHITLRPWSRAS